MAKLSSMMLNENTSAMEPITAEIIAIKYSAGRFCTLGVKRMTMNADNTNAVEPSRVLSRYFFVPNRRPINAADVSEIIRIANAVMVISFGKKRTQQVAEINTHVAPLNVFLDSCFSCLRRIDPNILEYKANVGLWTNLKISTASAKTVTGMSMTRATLRGMK